MARAIWNGSISFGLVTIPVKLMPAIRADEDVHFHFIHAADQGRIKNVRRCEACGKEVPWSQIVRGYEHQKGQYVTIDDQELASLRPEATQAVEIQAFVDRGEIEPMLFDAPYYLQPEARGRRAYTLLREALVKTGKVGIAQVVLRTRAHLAALTPIGDALVVELLHYPHEVIPAKELELPSGGAKPKAAEMKAAEMLIEAMVRPFDASEYNDDYEQKLRAALEARAQGHAPHRTKPRSPKATNVVDLAEVLRRSLAKRPAGPGVRRTTKRARSAARTA